MKTRIGTLILTTLIALIVPMSLLAVTIDVYTMESDDEKSIDGIEVNYFNAGLITAIEDHLSAGLPADEASAVEIARSRLNDQLKQQAVQGWAAITKIRVLGIKFLPAIVFDQSYVYYGHDLRRAKNLYDSHTYAEAGQKSP